MPKASKRGPLLNIQELAELFGKSAKTVRRRIKELSVSAQPPYSEEDVERHRTGAVKVLYFDPFTFGWEVPQATLGQKMSVQACGHEWTPRVDMPVTLGQHPELLTSTAVADVLPVQSGEHAWTADLSKRDQGDPALALLQPKASGHYLDLDSAVMERHRELVEVLRHPSKSADRAAAIRALADRRGVTPRAIYDEIKRYEDDGLRALARRRADAGAYRLPLPTMQLIVAALISNPPTTSVAFIHRTLLRAAPEQMHVERGGRLVPVSQPTIRAIKRDLENHPTYRLLFADATERKEFMRSYSGQVVALHANDMWQLDMTRCDVEVVDVERQQIYRPRVQAVIDVYSGCIMGIAFSESEDQTQADLVLMRSLMRKGGQLAEQYPLFGLPKRLYIDNGKTYSSEHFHRIAGGLGIEVIHSLPRVSHTRGAVERFFGSLHNLEKTMPGYVGENAINRSAEELRQLRRRTERWLDGGADPGPHARHMTIHEYQNAVLAWLIVEYHQWIVDGQTRLEHFQSTAPASSLLEFDAGELLLLFARRMERTVRPDGTVSWKGQAWTLGDGRLAQYRGMKVLLLEDQFALAGVVAVAYQDRTGRLEMLGVAEPAPDRADSIAAGDHRRAQKAVKRAALADADALAAQYRDPALMVSEQLRRELPVQAVTPVLPAARARITHETPPEPTDLDLGDFGKSFRPTDDFDALLASLGDDE